MSIILPNRTCYIKRDNKVFGLAIVDDKGIFVLLDDYVTIVIVAYNDKRWDVVEIVTL